MAGRLTRHRRRTAAAIAAILLAAAGSTGSHAAGPWRADAGNTEGWREMSPAERVEHQRRLRASGSYQECEAYQSAQRRRVRERAGRGASAPVAPAARATPPRQPASAAHGIAPAGSDGCRQLQAQGHWP